MFLSALLLYVATAAGVMQYGDDISMLQVTAAMVQGHIDVAPDAPAAVAGFDGRAYSKCAIGQSLLAVPFYLAGTLASEYRPGTLIVDSHGYAKANAVIYFVMLVGAFATAGTIAVLYLTCRALGFGIVASAATAGALGLCTFAWHYARTFMTEPTSMLASLGAYFGIVKFRNGREGKWLMLSGCAAALAILVRPSNGLIVAVVALWLARELRPEMAFSPAGALRKASLWMLPLAAGLSLAAIYNVARFGGILETGYGEEAHTFTTPLFVGLYGFLLSPGKSMFVYAPILVPALVFGWPKLAMRQRAAAGYAAAISAAYLVFFARYYMWYGGGVWGPRFLVVILPFMLLGLAALVDSPPRGFVGRLSLWLFAVVSLGVQIVSVVVPYVPYQARMNETPQLFSAFLWHPAASAVVAETASLLHWEFPPDLAPLYYRSPLLAIVQTTALVCALIAAVRVTGLVMNRQMWRSATLGSTDAALRAGR